LTFELGDALASRLVVVLQGLQLRSGVRSRVGLKDLEHIAVQGLWGRRARLGTSGNAAVVVFEDGGRVGNADFGG
jgi:hypothetical protein